MLILLKKAMVDMYKQRAIELLQKSDFLHHVLLLLVRHLLAHKHLFHCHLLRKPACLFEVFVDHFD